MNRMTPNRLHELLATATPLTKDMFQDMLTAQRMLPEVTGVQEDEIDTKIEPFINQVLDGAETLSDKAHMLIAYLIAMRIAVSIRLNADAAVAAELKRRELPAVPPEGFEVGPESEPEPESEPSPPKKSNVIPFPVGGFKGPGSKLVN